MFKLFKRKPKFKIKINYQNISPAIYEKSYTNFRILLKPMLFLSTDYYDEEYKYLKFNRFKSFYIQGKKQESDDLILVKLDTDNLTHDEFFALPWNNGIYIVGEEEFNRYSMCGKYESISLFRNKKELILNLKKIPRSYYDIFRFQVFPIIVDIFTNFDEEIINAFGNGIYNTLFGMVQLIELDNIDDNVFEQIKKYVFDIYNTILSMGEYKETFPTIQEYLDIQDAKKLEELRQKQKIEDMKQKQKNKFVEELAIKQELLKDFNRPLQITESL